MSIAMQPSPTLSRRSLLIIVDGTLDAHFFSQFATKGWLVEYAATNSEALNVVFERPFELVVTASATSAKADLQLLQQIRAIRPHTRLIILTNEGTTRDVIAALKQHAFSYFSPPYTAESVTRMIHLAMEQPTWDDGIEVLSATGSWIRLLARCDVATAERVQQFISEMMDFPDEERGEVAYAFREMMMNAMRYGGRFNPAENVEISYLRTRRSVACRVKDPGKGFEFDKLHHAAVSNPSGDPILHMQVREAEGLAPGGFGILLSRQLVDELIYNEQGNDVVMVKYLDGANKSEAKAGN